MAHKGLSPDAVVKAAVELIEQQGRDAFSMRLLADQLGIKTASLYNHVENMETLLSEVCRYGDAGNRGMAWRRGRAVSGRNVPQFCEGAPGTLLADHEYGGKR